MMTLQPPEARYTHPSKLALVSALTGLLVACGGGGGSADLDSGAPNLVISAANRDTVAQAAAASVVGLSAGTSSVPLASAGADRQVQASGNSGASLGRSALLPTTLRQQLRPWLQTSTRQSLLDQASRKHTLAVTGPSTTACSGGGSSTATVDDRDNSGTLSAGDTMTLVYSACQETAGETLSGQISLSITQTSGREPYPQQLAARLTLTQLTLSTGGRSLRSDGTMRMNLESESSELERYTVVIEDQLVSTLSGGSNTDTVTMMAGYTEQSVYEANLAPPEGGSTGRSTSTVAGNVRSTRAGGLFALSSPTALVQYDLDAYPRSGVLLARGSSGSLRLTVQSAQQVLLETDADGNGQYEDSSTVAWTTLL